MKYSELKVGDSIYAIVKNKSECNCSESFFEPTLIGLKILSIEENDRSEYLPTLPTLHILSFNINNRKYRLVLYNEWNEEFDQSKLYTLTCKDNIYYIIDAFIGPTKEVVIKDYIHDIDEQISNVRSIIEEGQKNLDNLNSLRSKFMFS